MGSSARHADHRGLLLLACLGTVGPAALLACGGSGPGSTGPSDAAGLAVAEGGTGADATVVVDSSGAIEGEAGFDGPATAGTEFLLPTTFIHASPSLPSVRLCWTDPGGNLVHGSPFPSSGPMPEGDYPGVAVGGASQGTSLAATIGGPIDIYALDAEMLAEGDAGADPCNALICSGGPPCFVGAPRYWYVGSVTPEAPPAFIALAGCLPSDPLATLERCGAGWTRTGGNLHAELLTPWGVPSGGVDGGSLAIQVAMLSPALAAAVGDAGTLSVSFGANGSASAVASLSGEDDIEPVPPASVALGGLASYGQLGFQVGAASPGDASMTPLWMSLADSMSLVNATADPRGYYGVDTTYVAAIIGDPATPWPTSRNDAGTYDGTGLHVLVLPVSSATQ